MATITVMGHCPADTDSTCSPIAYAWFLKEIKALDAEAVVSGKLNKEAEFVLQKFGVKAPQNIASVSEGDKLVLIDTNNPEELVKGWESAEIIEIVDHHKLYGIKTSNIPTVTVRPYGCVATVLWELMAEAHDKTPKDIAGLLLSCILSDTLKFTSPTTTEIDKKSAEELAQIAGVDIESLSSEMFAAKSNLDGMSAHDILLTDAKDFNFGDKLFKIGVLETTNPDASLSKRTELEAEMKNIISGESLAGMFFFVVNILTSESTLVTVQPSDLEIAEEAFGATRQENGLLILPGIVSRKKQIVPSIEKVVAL